MIESRDRVRILHLFGNFKGNNPLFTNLITGLNPERFQSMVCYLHHDSDQPNDMAGRGVPVYYLEEEKHLPSSRWPGTVGRIRSFLREHPVDVIHTHYYNEALLSCLATLGAGPAPAIVATLHARRRLRGTRRRVVGMWLARRGARLVGVSESVRQDILSSIWGISPDKVVTVQNGIDPIPFINQDKSPQEARGLLGLPREGFLIGTLGRLVPKKAHGQLIEAFHTFAGTDPDIHLVVAGEGRLRPQLEAQIASLGLKDRVVLTGHCRAVPLFLRSLDLFVLSSLREGLPLALLEAMAAGLPVVSTRAGGVAEAAEGIEGCILVDVGDVAGIAAGFRQVYRLPREERTRVGMANRRRVLEQFTWQRMVKDMMAVYESVLEERREH